MKIFEKFLVRRDLRCYYIYFEDEGPLEVSKESAYLFKLLKTNRSAKTLERMVKEKYPKVNAKSEVKEVLKTLRALKLLS